eukprot:6492790-Amphidinium_carterae.1
MVITSVEAGSSVLQTDAQGTLLVGLELLVHPSPPTVQNETCSALTVSGNWYASGMTSRYVCLTARD